jgi:hypothetical protein
MLLKDVRTLGESVKHFQEFITIKGNFSCWKWLAERVFFFSPFAKGLLNRVNILYKYFSTSHIGGSLLREAINLKNIEGGGLKKYVETRWITVYESVQSVVRLRSAFEYVSYYFYIILYYIILY